MVLGWRRWWWWLLETWWWAAVCTCHHLVKWSLAKHHGMQMEWQCRRPGPHGAAACPAMEQPGAAWTETTTTTGEVAASVGDGQVRWQTGLGDGDAAHTHTHTHGDASIIAPRVGPPWGAGWRQARQGPGGSPTPVAGDAARLVETQNLDLRLAISRGQVGMSHLAAPGIGPLSVVAWAPGQQH